jgi:hypothetical protein
MSVEQSVEWELAVKTKVLGEILSQCHFVYHKSHMTWPKLEPGPPRKEAGDKPPELWHGRYGGQLRIYRISSRVQPTRGVPPSWWLGIGLTTQHKIVLLRNIRQGLELGWIFWISDPGLITDGGEVVSLIRRLPFTPRKIPGTHLC